MIEEPVTIKTCPKCDADVRPNTQFCYNCGAILTAAETNGTGNNFTAVREKLLDEEAYKTGNLTPALEQPDETLVKSKPLGNPKDNAKSAQAAEKKIGNLKPAVPKRERPKKVIQKEVETYWEEYQSKSNIWFIAAAIIMAIFAVGIVFAMLQIR